MSDPKRDQVADRVRALIVEECDIEPTLLTDLASFEEDLGMDSLDKLEVVMACEEEFDIDIPDPEMTDVLTVGGLIMTVYRKVPA